MVEALFTPSLGLLQDTEFITQKQCNKLHSVLITDAEGFLKCKNTTTIHNNTSSLSEHINPTEGRTSPY